MSPSDNFTNVDQLAHSEASSPSDSDFFVESDIIELEWLIQNGFFDLSKYIDILNTIVTDFAGFQSYGANKEGLEGHDPAIPNDVQMNHHGDHRTNHPAIPRRAGQHAMARPNHWDPPLTGETGKPHTKIERNLSSSGAPSVELQVSGGETSAQTNEIASIPRDHPQAGVAQSSADTTSKSSGRRNRGSQRTPSEKVWRFKPYVYRPPISKDEPPKSTTSASDPPIPTPSSSSATSPSSSSQHEGEEDAPNPLSSAPIEELKKEVEEPATGSSKKRRGRILYKHVPYDPRKLSGPQSTTEFIEWGGPTDESFWGRRI